MNGSPIIQATPSVPVYLNTGAANDLATIHGVNSIRVCTSDVMNMWGNGIAQDVGANVSDLQNQRIQDMWRGVEIDHETANTDFPTLRLSSTDTAITSPIIATSGTLYSYNTYIDNAEGTTTSNIIWNSQASNPTWVNITPTVVSMGTFTISDSPFVVYSNPGMSDDELKKFLKRQKVKNNLEVAVKTRAELVVPSKLPENEQIAIETLREDLTETEFRRYLKYGFVLVEGKSGDVYQVYRNRSHTKIWRGGQLVEEVCVRIKDRSIPPTDNVIAFKAMIEFDEEEFKKSGNRYRNLHRQAA